MAEPTWMNSAGVITQPDAYKYLASNTVSGSTTTNIVFQTNDTADDGNWSFYKHLFMVGVYMVDSATTYAADGNEICIELNNDQSSKTDFSGSWQLQSNWRNIGHGTRDTMQFNTSFGDSYDPGSTIGTLGDYSGAVSEVQGDTLQAPLMAWIWFYNHNSTQSKVMYTHYGGWTDDSGSATPSSYIDGPVRAWNCMVWGMQNEDTYSASNLNYVPGPGYNYGNTTVSGTAYGKTKGVEPITEIDLYVSDGENWIAPTRWDLYGVFPNMTGVDR